MKFIGRLAAGAWFWLAGLDAAAPPAHRGLYAIWASNDVLDLPYITGGQVVVQWADLEPAEGRYDFAPIEAALRALEDKPATLQVNGNRKPAWLFDAVPYCQEKLGEQVADPQGTLMYWHPRHQQAYLSFLQAYGGFVKAARWREQVLGIRLNFNALGTEHWSIPAEHRDLGTWITPPGVAAGTAWTRERGAAYRGEVLRAFVEVFAPTVRVFVRNNIELELREPFEAQFGRGELAWFHTSTEIEPRAAWGELQYQTFLDSCRSGTTVGYAEQWASAWGHHGGQTDARWCSPPQWNYWRLLADLHCGVSFIAVYGSDLTVAKQGTYRRRPVPQYQDEFRLAFEFARDRVADPLDGGFVLGDPSLQYRAMARTHRPDQAVPGSRIRLQR